MRFCLRRMAASYVLVSAAAVLLVEAALLAVTVPRIREADQGAEQARRRAAEAEANVIQVEVNSVAALTATIEGDGATMALAREPGRTDEALLVEAAADGLGDSVAQRPNEDPKAGPELVMVLATTDGRVVASSPEGAFAQRASLPAEAVRSSPGGGRTQVNGRAAYWATMPVEITKPSGNPRRMIGIAYAVRQARDAEDKAGENPDKEAATKTPISIGSLVIPGVFVLILLVPVGALFGLLSTGLLIRRIRRLADGTSAMADGDLQARIPVSGGDEVGRLEQAFNSMAEHLDAALEVQRKAAGSAAQRAERARIARELHDSITQDLFSASLLAGGLRKALPPGSELRRQAEAMELSLARTMREMRAMLLELRPIAVEEADLAEALDELCRAYQDRLGIVITRHIDDPLLMDAPVEHALFRVVQETLGNAIRHGKPATAITPVDGLGGITWIGLVVGALVLVAF